MRKIYKWNHLLLDSRKFLPVITSLKPRNPFTRFKESFKIHLIVLFGIFVKWNSIEGQLGHLYSGLCRNHKGNTPNINNTVILGLEKCSRELTIIANHPLHISIQISLNHPTPKLLDVLEFWAFVRFDVIQITTYIYTNDGSMFSYGCHWCKTFCSVLVLVWKVYGRDILLCWWCNYFIYCS